MLYDAIITEIDLSVYHLDAAYYKYIKYHKGNVLDQDDLYNVTKSFNPSVVIHLSSYGMSGAAMLSKKCLDINVQGVENTIEAALACSVSDSSSVVPLSITYSKCFYVVGVTTSVYIYI